MAPVRTRLGVSPTDDGDCGAAIALQGPMVLLVRSEWRRVLRSASRVPVLSNPSAPIGAEVAFSQLDGRRESC
jgi:hypothetical protein